ncbi:hypothetical protein M758_N022500 [Ceratodon purpureus]|nr:hypothetical protein M758_N022500 [Ceratodon purpureus]
MLKDFIRAMWPISDCEFIGRVLPPRTKELSSNCHSLLILKKYFRNQTGHCVLKKYFRNQTGHCVPSVNYYLVQDKARNNMQKSIHEPCKNRFDILQSFILI